MDGAAKQAPVMAVVTGIVITDGATVITDRATTVLEIPTASVVTMPATVTESESETETEGSTTPSAMVRSTGPDGGAEVEGEAAAATAGTRSVEVVARRSGSREDGPRRDDDATRLSVIRLTRGPSSRGCHRLQPGRRGWR